MKSREQISVRRYQEKDLEGVITVFQMSVRRIAVRDYTPMQIAVWSEVDKALWQLKLRKNLTWLAFKDGFLAGFLSVEKGGYIDLLFTHPDYQRNGVATKLVETMEAALSGIETRLVTEASITAQPFFIRHGFVVCNAQRVSLRGEVFINNLMKKRL